jgi:hypothetical protein
MPLGRLDVAGSTGEDEAVHGLRVLGIDLEALVMELDTAKEIQEEVFHTRPVRWKSDTEAAGGERAGGGQVKRWPTTFCLGE